MFSLKFLQFSITFLFNNILFDFFLNLIKILSLFKPITYSIFFNYENFLVFEGLFTYTTKSLPSFIKAKSSDKLSYASNYFTNNNSQIQTKYFNEELSSSSRYLRFNNPVFKYDYKSGDYFPKLYKEVYTYLFSSINDLTGGLKQAP
jgi:hypothetical protein